MANQASVTYKDYVVGKFVDATIGGTSGTTYTLINSENLQSGTWNEGYYVVGTDYDGDGDIDTNDAVVGAGQGKDTTFTISDNVTVSGDVKLILVDGFTLNVTALTAYKAGITVTNADLNNPTNKFTIYGQENGTGTLNAQGNTGAGIGGDKKNGSFITINGGNVNATGTWGGAGIGGGVVDDNDNDGGAIGSNITINGGKVNATGSDGGAGIGGGYDSCGATITITGGTVTAKGSDDGAGIGGGAYNTSGSSNISITGGTVTAIGGGTNVSGIGNGAKNPAEGTTAASNITVGEGMTVKAGASESPTTKIADDDGDGDLADELAGLQYATVTPPPVASITDATSGKTTEYDSLAAAVNAVTANQTIKLLADIAETEAVTAKAIAFTIDLAGCDYSNTAENGLVTVSGTKITLTDSTTPETATAFNAAITGAGAVIVNGNISLDHVTSAADITNSGTLTADGMTLNNALLSDGTLNVKNSTINVDDSSQKHMEEDTNSPISLEGDTKLTNVAIKETFGAGSTGDSINGIMIWTGNVEFATDEGRTTALSVEQDKASAAVHSNVIAINDTVSLTFSGAGNLDITAHMQGDKDASSPYGNTMQGVQNGATVTFANEGKTTLTVSSEAGVAGVVNGVSVSHTAKFTDGNVLINTYLDGGVGQGCCMGILNLGQLEVTSGVDELTIFTEGEEHEDSAALYNCSSLWDNVTTTINAKKLNILVVAGEDTDKEWTIGGTAVMGHTTYSEEKKTAVVGSDASSTVKGILNTGSGTTTVGADSVTDIHTRNYGTNANSAAVVARSGAGTGGVSILGDTTIVAEGGDGTYALYASDGSFITVGSEGKYVSITGDILATGSGSTITLAGSSNTITGTVAAEDGAAVNLKNVAIIGNVAETKDSTDTYGTVKFIGANTVDGAVTLETDKSVTAAADSFSLRETGTDATDVIALNGALGVSGSGTDVAIAGTASANATIAGAVTVGAGATLDLENAVVNDSISAEGTLTMKNSTINVDDSSKMHVETGEEYDYNNAIDLQGKVTLTNVAINETFGGGNTGNYVRGIKASKGTVELVAEADKTTTVSFLRDMARTDLDTGRSYVIELDKDAGMAFSGAGNLAINARQLDDVDANSQLFSEIYGIENCGTLTFANEGRTTFTVSSQFGVMGMDNKGTTEFTDGTVLINTYVDGGVARGENISFNNIGQMNATAGVDELTIFTEGTTYDEYFEESGSGKTAALNNTGGTTINAKKLNILAVAGEDTSKEWTIGGATVTGHTTYSAEKKQAVAGADAYSTVVGIMNGANGNITVGADTVTTIHTRNYGKNAKSVAVVASLALASGGVSILGDTTIVAEGGDGTKALCAEMGGFITVGSDGKTVSITGDILATGSFFKSGSAITIAGSSNTITGNVKVSDGARFTTANATISGAVTVGAGATLDLENVAIGKSLSNSGTADLDHVTTTEGWTLAAGSVTNTNALVNGTDAGSIDKAGIVSGTVYASSGTLDLRGVDLQLKGDAAALYGGTADNPTTLDTLKATRVLFGDQQGGCGDQTIGTIVLENCTSGYRAALGVYGGALTVDTVSVNAEEGWYWNQQYQNYNYQMYTSNGGTLTVNTSLTTGEYVNAFGVTGTGTGATNLGDGTVVNAVDFLNMGAVTEETKAAGTAHVNGAGATLNAAVLANHGITSLGMVNLTSHPVLTTSAMGMYSVNYGTDAELTIGQLNFLNLEGDSTRNQMRFGDNAVTAIGGITTNAEVGVGFYVTQTSSTSINKTGGNAVKLTGDIVFTTYSDADSSGATFSLNLDSNDDFFTGSVKGTVSSSARWGKWGSAVMGDEVASGSPVTGMAISVSNGAVWTVTDDSSVGTLAIDGGAVRMTEQETISVSGAWSSVNGGTLTVDMDGAAYSIYKLVDYTGTGSMGLAGYGSVVLENNPETDGYVTKVVNNDLYAMKAGAMQMLYVDDDWAGLADGTVLADGRIIGTNAFATIQDAVKADVSEGMVTISVAAGTYDETIDLNQSNLAFQEDGETWYGRLKLVGEEGADVTGGGFTFGNGVAINVADVTISGFMFDGHDSPIYIDNGSCKGRNIAITGNTFNYQGAGPFVASGTLDGLTVTGNAFNSTTGNNATIGNANGGTIGNATISGNTFANYFGLYGKVLAGGVDISGNTFTGSCDEPIWLNNRFEASEGTVTLTDNTIAGTYTYALGYRVTNAYTTKEDIVIGSGNTYGGEALTAWADADEGKLLVSEKAKAGEAQVYGGRLYLGDDTSFKTARAAYDACAADGTLVMMNNDAPVEVAKADIDMTVIYVSNVSTAKEGTVSSVAGKDYYHGLNSVSTVEDAAGTITAEVTKVLFAEGSYTGGYGAAFKNLGTGTLVFSTVGKTVSSDPANGAGTALTLGAGSSEACFFDAATADKYELAAGSDLTVFKLGTENYGNVLLSVNGKLTVQGTIATGAGTRMDIGEDAALALDGSVKPSANGTGFYSYGTTKVQGSLKLNLDQITGDAASRIEIGSSSNQNRDARMDVDGGTVTVREAATAEGTSAGTATTEIHGCNSVLEGDAAASLNVTNGGLYDTTGAIINNGNITVDVKQNAGGRYSLIQAGTFTNNGVITVDLSDATKSVYKLIDSGTGSDYGTFQFADGTGDGYVLRVVDNDLYAFVTPDSSGTLLVNSAWNGFENGTPIDGMSGFYYGINAFSNTATALTVVSDGNTIKMLCGFDGDTVNFNQAGSIVYSVDLNGFDYTTAGAVTDSIVFKDSTQTFKAGSYSVAAGKTLTVEGRTRLEGSSFSNAGTLVIDIEALVLASTWSGNGGIINVTAEGDLTESFYKIVDQDSGSTALGDYGTLTFNGGSDLPSGYIWAVEGGDLALKKADAQAAQKDEETDKVVVSNEKKENTYVSESIEAPAKDVIVEADSHADELKVTGDISGNNTSITNEGDSVLVTRDVKATETASISTSGSGEKTTVEIGGAVSGKDITIENTKDTGNATVSADNGFMATNNATVTNSGNGDLAVKANVYVKGGILEIRNETNFKLDASGKLEVKDIRIYNNDWTCDTTVGVIEITDQIEASGKIEVNNNNLTEKAGVADNGVIHLGTQTHSAQEGMTIINKTENVINGSGTAGVDEQAANIEIASGDVVIDNSGHLNANITAENSAISITNTSMNTLITNTIGEGITVHSSGAIADSTFTADDVNISLNGTISNTQITAKNLTFESSAYQVVTFDWNSSKNFTFSQSFTVNGKVVIDATSFTGDNMYLLIDNQTATAEDYSNVILSDTSKGRLLVVKDNDLYLMKNTNTPTISTELDNVYDDGTRKWIGTNTAATVTVTTTDNSGSEIATNTYKLDAAAQQNATNNPYTLTLASTDGSHTYAFNASDNNGNIAQEVILTYGVDGTGPAIGTIALGGVKDDNDVYWFRQGTDARISADITDDKSGVKAATLNGQAYESGDQARIETLYETGAAGNAYTFKAVDNVGNESAESSVTIGVDGTGPDIDEAALAGDSIHGQWIKAGTAATVTTAITDALSGLGSATLDGVAYDGAKFTIATTAGQDTDIAAHDIVAADKVGNETTATVYYGIDGTGPDFGAATLVGDSVSGQWVKAGASFAVSMGISDAKSGLAGATLAGAAYADGQFALTAGTEESAITDYAVAATDNVGNESAATVSYGVDGTGPDFGAYTLSGDHVSGNWVKAGETFAVNMGISDAKSGLASATLKGAAYADGQFVLTAGGESGIAAYTATAMDKVGNVATTTVSYGIDATGPTITVASDPDQSQLCTSVTVTARFADSLSGLASAQYSLDGTAWSTFDGDTLVLENISKCLTIYFRAYDKVGNESTAQFVVDNIVEKDKQFVVDGIVRNLADDLTAADFFVINGGVLDGLEGKTLTADNLYLKGGTVKAIDGVIDNIVAISGDNDISGMDNLLVRNSVQVQSGNLTINAQQYDEWLEHVALDIDGALTVTDVVTVSMQDIARLQTHDTISEITFKDATLSDISKLTFAASTTQRIGFGTLVGTSKKDTITVNKNAQVVLTGDIDLGASADTVELKSNARLVLDGVLSNVNAIKLANGSTYKANGSSCQRLTEFIAEDIAFSGERGDKLATGKYSSFHAGNVSGAISISLGAFSTTAVGDISGTAKLAIANGKQGQTATLRAEDVAGTDANDSFKLGNWNEVALDSLDFGNGNDSLSLGSYTELDINGRLTFGDSISDTKDALSLGKGATLSVDELDVSSLDKLTMGKDAYLVIADAGDLAEAKLKWAKYANQIVATLA